MKDTRLGFLDGLRGLLAFVVFLHHIFYLFYPQFLFGGSAQDFSANQNYTIGKFIALSPLNVLFNPAMAIHFFFLLSGYVQTRAYFVHNETSLLKRGLLKRYLRLALPTLAVVMLLFIFHQLKLIHKEWIPANTLSDSWKNALMPDALSFFGALQHGLFGSFFSSSNYYQVLWTMPIEMANSYLILLALLLTHRVKNKLPVLLLLLVFQSFFANAFFAMAFGFGSLIAYGESKHDSFRQFFSQPVVKVFCWLAGFFFASYPFTAYKGSLHKSIYGCLGFFENNSPNPVYLMGTVLLFCALLNAPGLKKTLGKSTLVLLGKVSFMLYLAHLLLLCSFSAYLFQLFSRSFDPIGVFVSTFLSSMVLALGAAFLLHVLVERLVLKGTGYLAQRLLKRQ